MIMRNMRIWPTSSSKDKLFPIPTHRGSFFFSSGEHWQTAEILKLEIISSSMKMKNKIYLSSRRVVADTNINTVQHYSISSAPVFRCCKLLNFKSWQGRKESVFILWRIFLWKKKFFGNMLNQKEIYLPSRVQSKHICQVTLWMCMWIEDINLNPQCKESCTQNRATLM